jgi:hypothetical protein
MAGLIGSVRVVVVMVMLIAQTGSPLEASGFTGQKIFRRS